LSLNSKQKQAAEKEEENDNKMDSLKSEISTAQSEISSTNNIHGWLSDISELFVCPVTQKTMVDPVIATDGHTYERKAIEEWFGKGKRTSPMTGLQLDNINLIPNIALRQVIEKFMHRIP
jgi:sacsin